MVVGLLLPLPEPLPLPLPLALPLPPVIVDLEESVPVVDADTVALEVIVPDDETLAEALAEALVWVATDLARIVSIFNYDGVERFLHEELLLSARTTMLSISGIHLGHNGQAAVKVERKTRMEKNRRW